MKPLLVALGLWLLSFPSFAQQPPGPPPDIFKRRVVYSVPGMDGVRARRDLPFQSGDATLKMDLYLPKGSAPRSGWPTVVFIHGGPVPPGITPKDWGVYQSYGELTAASGLAAVTFNHRLNAPADYPRAADDVTALLAHLRTEAPKLKLDPEKLAVWAFSGGGPLLASVLAQRSASLRCAAAFYPLLATPEGTPADPRLSPLEQLQQAGGSIPPLLIARAGRDNPALNATVEAFVRTAVEKGVTLDLLTHPNGQHGFDILDDDARSRTVIRRTLAFLRENLIGP
jgi:acetyl esterase/lipase